MPNATATATANATANANADADAGDAPLTTLATPPSGARAASAKTQPLLAVESRATDDAGAARDVLILSRDVILIQKEDSLLVSAPKPPRSIPYYNILWVEITEDQKQLRIDFVAQASQHVLEPRHVEFPIPALAAEQSPHGNDDEILSWVERLMDRAYGNAARRKRAWVLVNPHAGTGGADKIWDKQVRPIFAAARMPMTVIRTTYSGEGVDLARDINIDDYDIAIPCSGDGLPHEVFNGLAQRPDARRALSKIAVCHIPCGSGNAMSCNLYGTYRPTLAALAIVKGIPTPLDLISVTQGEKRIISFLSQALGMIADLDITTEHLRWMGASRFTYGFLVLAMKRKVYPCDIAVKVEIHHKDDVKEHYRRNISNAGSETETGEMGQQSTHGGLDNDHEDKNNGIEAGPGTSYGPSSIAPSSAESENSPGLPPLKYGTVKDKLPDGWELIPHEKLGTFYCGNMAYMAPDANFFAGALANDGLMDLITSDGDISPLKAIGLQMSVDSGHFFDSPLVSYRKVSAYRIIPRPGQDPSCCISIDGEAIPFEPFQAEVHKGLGLTLSKKGGFEAPGPINWDKVTNTERMRA
ncbi:ATP-NAD kinase-like domain-containing protein [Cercophora scortea]|uniref:ATP-NAD kinase-like domain-containing protein n=1 Tax=Cercophora scortea TaxID=314031 RepID=A0AAE0IE16_9PEZI|nr:ATP-NAD kinase-like domain-containing protein [Cercophora scortea]